MTTGWTAIVDGKAKTVTLSTDDFNTVMDHINQLTEERDRYRIAADSADGCEKLLRDAMKERDDITAKVCALRGQLATITAILDGVTEEDLEYLHELNPAVVRSMYSDIVRRLKDAVK